MSEDVLYFGLAFKMDITPELPENDTDELLDLFEEFRTECGGASSVNMAKDYFYITTRSAKSYDGIYGMHSIRNVETELLQNLQTFRLWMIDQGYEINLKPTVKPFVDLYYNGSDASPVYTEWEKI
jgi:hypothetical protein